MATWLRWFRKNRLGRTIVRTVLTAIPLGVICVFAWPPIIRFASRVAPEDVVIITIIAVVSNVILIVNYFLMTYFSPSSDIMKYRF